MPYTIQFSIYNNKQFIFYQKSNVNMYGGEYKKDVKVKRVHSTEHAIPLFPLKVESETLSILMPWQKHEDSFCVKVAVLSFYMWDEVKSK